MNQYGWDDLGGLTSLMLLRNENDSELACAQGIWELLGKEGLTSYASEVERHRVLIFLLAVVEFVNDCTALIHDDSYELELTQWASELEMSSFRIAQIAGAEFEDTDEYDENELIRFALFELTAQARQTIKRAIKKTYVNETAIMKFIGNFYEESTEDDRDYEDLVKFYGEPKITGSAAQFLMWISTGMARRN